MIRRQIVDFQLAPSASWETEEINGALDGRSLRHEAGDGGLPDAFVGGAGVPYGGDLGRAAFARPPKALRSPPRVRASVRASGLSSGLTVEESVASVHRVVGHVEGVYADLWPSVLFQWWRRCSRWEPSSIGCQARKERVPTPRRTPGADRLRRIGTDGTGDRASSRSGDVGTAGEPLWVVMDEVSAGELPPYMDEWSTRGRALVGLQVPSWQREIGVWATR